MRDFLERMVDQTSRASTTAPQQRISGSGAAEAGGDGGMGGTSLGAGAFDGPSETVGGKFGTFNMRGALPDRLSGECLVGLYSRMGNMVRLGTKFLQCDCKL